MHLTTVLTLIAGEEGRLSLPDAVAEIGRTLGRRVSPVWLAPGEACDLVFAARGASEAVGIEAAARAILGDTPVDLVIQRTAGRCKRLLVADLESTIIENEMLDDLAGVATRAVRSCTTQENEQVTCRQDTASSTRFACSRRR